MNTTSVLLNIMLPFATVMIPDLEEMENERDDFYQSLKDFFKSIDAKTKKQLFLLLHLINFLSYLYNAKGFNKLSYSSRKKYIKKLFNLPINKIVGGLIGLRSLCFFTYYTQEKQWKKINYDGPIKK